MWSGGWLGPQKQRELFYFKKICNCNASLNFITKPSPALPCGGRGSDQSVRSISNARLLLVRIAGEDGSGKTLDFKIIGETTLNRHLRLGFQQECVYFNIQHIVQHQYINPISLTMYYIRFLLIELTTMV